MKTKLKYYLMTIGFIIFLLAFLILFIKPVYIFFFSTTRSNSVEISNIKIDNSYNNTKANDMSDLTALNDKLYFNYSNKVHLNSGTYEIRSGEGKRISSKQLILDNTYHGKLLDLSSRPITFYDSDLGHFSNYSGIQIPENMYWCDAFVCNDTFFLFHQMHCINIMMEMLN